MDLQEMGVNVRIHIDLIQDIDYWGIYVIAELNTRVPQAMKLIYFSVCRLQTLRSRIRSRHFYIECISKLLSGTVSTQHREDNYVAT